MNFDPAKYSGVFFVGGFYADDGNGGSSPTDAWATLAHAVSVVSGYNGTFLLHVLPGIGFGDPGGWTLPGNFDLDAGGAAITTQDQVLFIGRVLGGNWNNSTGTGSGYAFVVYGDTENVTFQSTIGNYVAQFWAANHHCMRVIAGDIDGAILVSGGPVTFDECTFEAGDSASITIQGDGAEFRRCQVVNTNSGATGLLSPSNVTYAFDCAFFVPNGTDLLMSGGATAGCSFATSSGNQTLIPLQAGPTPGWYTDPDNATIDSTATTVAAIGTAIIALGSPAQAGNAPSWYSGSTAPTVDQIAIRLLVTPANKLATSGTGSVFLTPGTAAGEILLDAGMVTTAEAGDGTTAVDHNTGGTDNLAYRDAIAGIEGARIRAYLKTDFDAGTYTVRGTAGTDVNGRWIRPMYLDSGNTYSFVFEKPGVCGPDVFEQAL